MEDFKFWVLAAGNAHRLPEKEIVFFCQWFQARGISEEIYLPGHSRRWWMLWLKQEYPKYRDITEISEQIKRPEAKKESKDSTPEAHISRKSGSYTKSLGASFAKDSKASISGKSIDINVECFKCHKKGHYADKCSDAKGKDGKGFFKRQKLDSSNTHQSRKRKRNR